MEHDENPAGEEPALANGLTEGAPGKEPPRDRPPPDAAGARARRPSSRMPANSLFYERILPLLLIVLLIAVAALIIVIVWGVVTGTYA